MCLLALLAITMVSLTEVSEGPEGYVTVSYGDDPSESYGPTEG